ncbi:MAG: hypothetical protein Q3X94_03030 [Oscillospiraceae bacterium]|nr:hypothetical protein [Oscillospiraceae bacterium]
MTANEYHSIVICVDGYDQHILRGRLYNPFLQGAVHFTGLMEFLLAVEHLLDEMNFPQPFAQVRSFRPQAKAREEIRRDNLEQRGERGTFVMKVIFRQNASWQGTVLWLEANREESFRSVLEFALLLNSALDEKGEGS